MGTYDTIGGTPISPEETDPCPGCPYEEECDDPEKCLWEEHNPCPGDPLEACEEIEGIMRRKERARWKA